MNLTGKTILSSSLISEIESRIRSGSEPSSSLLYFFCSYKEPDKNNCLALLRSLIWQRILQDNDLIPYIYDQYINNPSSASYPRCKKLLNDLLGECTPCGFHPIYIVLDGLTSFQMRKGTVVSGLKTNIDRGAIHVHSKSIHCEPGLG